MADVRVSVPVTLGHCIHAKATDTGALDGERFDYRLFGRFGLSRFGSKVRAAKGDDVIVLGVEYATRHYVVDVDDLERIAKTKDATASGKVHSLYE